jgi:hypothetical protein
MQVVFYGYGTGWHWCYYLPLTVQTLHSIALLYSLRYKPATWDAFRFVQAWSALVVSSLYMEIILPIPGFVTERMLHLVPFRSPTWILAYYYIVVWHLPFVYPWQYLQKRGSVDSDHVKIKLRLGVCGISVFSKCWWVFVQLPIILLEGHVRTLFSAWLSHALTSRCINAIFQINQTFFLTFQC